MRLSLKQLKKLEDTPPWDWPEGTGAALLEVLRDSAATEKELLVAVEMAGSSVVVDDDLVGALLAVLRNSQVSEGVRSRAAIALGPVLELADTEIVGSGTGHFDDPDSVPISERTFHEIQQALHRLYLDATVPKVVRRRMLEVAVRGSQDWHQDAVRAAYACDDEAWKLTAVFGMRHVRGFDEQILESLESKNPEIHVEAVWAAGAWHVEAAWEHVVGLVSAGDTERTLLLAAIVAVGEIHPKDAPEVLGHLEDSDDPEIREAVLEATSMTGERDEEADDLEEEEPDPLN